MLSVLCNRCGCCLDKPGGLVFSPPDNDSRIIKYNFCVDCYDSLLDWMDLGKQEEESDDEYLPPAKSTLAQERKAYELEDIVKCPKCDSAMRLRTNRNTGTSFFGCVDFPDCKGTREADGSVGITTRKSSPPPPPPPASYRPPYSSVGYDYNDEDDIPF